MYWLRGSFSTLFFPAEVIMDQYVNDPAPSHPCPDTPQPTRARNWITLIALGFFVVAVVAGGMVWWKSRKKSDHKAGAVANNGNAPEGGILPDVKVKIISPRKGGIDRVCVQPGTLEPFEFADLYAKVSGFLAVQNVDIGSRVKAGQLLARIDVPELRQQVKRDEASLEHEKAKVAQVEANITAAESEAKAAVVAVALARTVHNAKSAYRKYRQKQLSRLTQLRDARALDEKVVDESNDQFQASVESEAAAKEAISAAQERVAVAKAKIIQARAALEEARASVKVAEATYERSKVLLGYTEITSPYDGVITRRTYNRGDFIRAADSGGEARMPLLSVERTDRMRVVVQVPDRDVPYVDEGDPADVETDAYPGRTIKAKVSRMAASEDEATRTMRTEIDVDNPGGKLRRGMYGRVTIHLYPGNPSALTVPSAALRGKAEGTHAEVWVERQGFAHKLNVTIGADNGVRAEVLAGLQPSDRVIVRANGPLQEGTPVKTSITNQ
jgi:RND family efflux transporter MFP subunit